MHQIVTGGRGIGRRAGPAFLVFPPGDRLSRPRGRGAPPGAPDRASQQSGTETGCGFTPGPNGAPAKDASLSLNVLPAGAANSAGHGPGRPGHDVGQFTGQHNLAAGPSFAAEQDAQLGVDDHLRLVSITP